MRRRRPWVAANSVDMRCTPPLASARGAVSWHPASGRRVHGHGVSLTEVLLVRRLAMERAVREHRIVFGDIEFDEPLHGREVAQLVQEQPLVLDRPKPRLDHGVGEAHVDLRNDALGRRRTARPGQSTASRSQSTNTWPPRSGQLRNRQADRSEYGPFCLGHALGGKASTEGLGADLVHRERGDLLALQNAARRDAPFTSAKRDMSRCDSDNCGTGHDNDIASELIPIVR